MIYVGVASEVFYKEYLLIVKNCLANKYYMRLTNSYTVIYTNMNNKYQNIGVFFVSLLTMLFITIPDKFAHFMLD